MISANYCATKLLPFERSRCMYLMHLKHTMVRYFTAGIDVYFVYGNIYLNFSFFDSLWNGLHFAVD